MQAGFGDWLPAKAQPLISDHSELEADLLSEPRREFW
jgi:hypothetical protein